MKEASNKKTQRVKNTQYNPLYLLSKKTQVDSKRVNVDESNMFKENIIKKCFKSLCDSEWSRTWTDPDMDLTWTLHGPYMDYIVQIDDLSTPEYQ